MSLHNDHARFFFYQILFFLSETAGRERHQAHSTSNTTTTEIVARQDKLRKELVKKIPKVLADQQHKVVIDQR